MGEVVIFGEVLIISRYISQSNCKESEYEIRESYNLNEK